MLHRSWVEIDINTVVSNYNIYKQQLKSSQKIMAVVKADGYGHDAVKVSLKLQEAGCNDFAVSNIDEAKQLRIAGINGQILILGYTPISSVGELLKYDITQTLISEEYAFALKGRGVKAQFAVDTGMNRVGIDADDIVKCEMIIRKYFSEYRLTGIFTHLCVADDFKENQFTSEQIDKFKQLTERIYDLNLPYIHCLNTAGGLYHQLFGSMVRLGISLYGLRPNYENKLPVGIKPALKWKSVIAMTKEVLPGETIGYGRTYRAERKMTVATIPTGYADGFNRALANRGCVFINGKRANVVGSVCMDMIMVDITGIEVNFEDEVELIGDRYTADDMAHDVGTIGYEIVCDIGKRVERVFL